MAIASETPAAPAGRRALIGSGVAVGTAVVAANGFNAVFQLALARILEPSEYSLLAALFTIVLIAAVPTIAFQASVAREVAGHLAEGNRDAAAAALGGTLRASLVWTGGLLALTLLAFGPLAAAIGLHRSLPVIATSATIALALGIPIVWGGLQGSGRFLALSVAQIVFAGARLTAGLGVGLAGGQATAVMGAVAAATALAVGLSLVPLRPLLGGVRGVAHASRRLATLPNGAAAVALTALTALTMADLLVAKLAFPGHLAGAYAAGSVGARVLLLVPVGVTTVLFPRVATLADPRNERRHLLAGLLAVGLVSAPLVALLWALAGPLIDLTFGSKYHAATPWLGPLSLAMALYALVYVYLFHFLSLGRSRFALALAGLLGAQLLLFGLLHGRPAELIGIQLGLGAATLAASELWYLRRS
jgi:O-antigen/teichoic acid export membrane protein